MKMIWFYSLFSFNLRCPITSKNVGKKPVHNGFSVFPGVLEPYHLKTDPLDQMDPLKPQNKTRSVRGNFPKV